MSSQERLLLEEALTQAVEEQNEKHIEIFSNALLDQIEQQQLPATQEIVDQSNIAPQPQSELEPEEDVTVLGGVGEFFKAIPRGFANSYLSSAEGLAEISDAATNVVGLEEAIDSGDANAMVSFARDGRRAVQGALGANEAYQDLWSTKLGEGVGSFASFFGPAGFVKLLGLAGKGAAASKAASTGALAVGGGAGDQAQRIEAARQAGIDISQADEDAAILLGGAVGATELLTVNMLLRRLSKKDMTPEQIDGVRGAISSALKTGSIEGTQEVLASVLQDSIERRFYNEDLPAGESLFDDFTIGATIGAGADLVTSAFIGKARKKRMEAILENEEQERERFSEKVAMAERDLDLVERGRLDPTVIEPTPETDPSTIIPPVAEMQTDPLRAANLAEAERIGVREKMYAYAQKIAGVEGANFPFVGNVFVATPTAENQNQFEVLDSDGNKHGVTLSKAEAIELADHLNEIAETKNIVKSLIDRLETSPDSYTKEQTQKLLDLGLRANSPSFGRFTSLEIDMAAEADEEAGFNPNKSVRELEQEGVKKKDYTPSQKINAKRLERGLSEDVTHSVEDAKKALGDKFELLAPEGRKRTVDSIKALLEIKNIEAPLGSKQLRFLMEKFIGVPASSNRRLYDLTKGEINLLYKRLEELPSFESPTKLPDLRLPNYTAIQFSAASDLLNKNPTATDSEIAAAARIDLTKKSGRNKLASLKQDLASQGTLELAETNAKRIQDDQLEQAREDAQAEEVSIDDISRDSLETIDLSVGMTLEELSEATGRTIEEESQIVDRLIRQGAVIAEDFDGVLLLTVADQASADIAADDLDDIQPSKVDEADPVAPLEEQDSLLDGLTKTLREQMQRYGLGDVAVNIDHALRTVARDSQGNLVYGIKAIPIKTLKNLKPEDVELYGQGDVYAFVGSELDQGVEGYYSPNIGQIFLGIDRIKAQRPDATPEQIANDMISILDHEIVHALRQLDVFKQTEWKLLSGLSAKKKRSDGSTYLEWAASTYQGDELSNASIVEEAVAEMVRDGLANARMFGGKPQSIINKIKQFFQRLNNSFSGSGFASFEDMIQKINSGEIGSRDVIDGQRQSVVRTPYRLEKTGRLTSDLEILQPLSLEEEERQRRLDDFEMSKVAPIKAEMGINVRTDGESNYADLIVGGEKRYESRDKDSLRPYVGQRVGIIETGSGPAKLVGYATVGEPIEVGETEFSDSRDQHLVPEGSKFDIKPGQSKFLYEMIDPERLPEPIDASATRGIVARNISQLGDEGVRPQRRGDGRGRDQTRSVAPTEDQDASTDALPEAPVRVGATGPDPAINVAAKRYAETFDIPVTRQKKYVRVDLDRAERIAQAYEDMVDDPTDPIVKEAYEDLVRQTRNQYDALIDAGFEFTFYDSNSDPYDGNPYNAMRDLRNNKRMAVYGTYDGYGTLEDFNDDLNDPDRVMLRDSGLRWKDQSGADRIVTNNDLFRAVHDAFGHGIEGAGFRARGEENAWQAHAKLFTGPALQALTSETRGQNSWLNFGPYGEQNRTAGVLDTVFAEQKMGLMPEWTSREGRDGLEDDLSLDESVFARRAAEQGGVEGNVSTRFPTGKKAKEDPIEDLLVNDYGAFVDDRPVFIKNMKLIKDALLYPLLRKGRELRTDEQKAEAFVDLVKDNLLYIHDSVPVDIREQSKVWYNGANSVVRRFADRHKITMQQAAAVAAVLSPQKDWYQNASLAERTIDTFFNHARQPFTPEMKARAEELFFHKGIEPKAQARNREMLELIGSSSLEQILRKFNEPGLGQRLGAMWIRTFDQTYNDPSYRIVSPDGRLLDYAKNADGSNSKIAWGPLSEIAKSIEALREVDIDVISATLGSANKVRNFYNNIYDPESDLGYVTIDTHAVAAGLLKPLGGSAFEVSHNFGTKGSSSQTSGINGVYSLYEEGYRRAAKERGILPREMQSITWEASRGLFQPDYKRQKKNIEFVNDVWRQYNSKRITLDQAREIIYEHAGQVTPPEWYRSDGAVSDFNEATTYERKLPDSGIPRPRPNSAARRRGRSDAAAEVQAEADVGTVDQLVQRFIPKPPLISDAQVNLAVKKDEEIAETVPATFIPRINPDSDGYTQAVARDPDQGQTLDDLDDALFSRSNTPDLKPEEQKALESLVAEPPPDSPPGMAYLGAVEEPEWRTWLDKVKSGAINRYARIERLLNKDGRFSNHLADVSSMSALLMADRSIAVSATALQKGIPVYKDGATSVEPFFHQGKKYKGLIGVMEPLFNNQYGKNLEQLAQAYAIAQRGMRLNQEGKAVPGDPEANARIQEAVDRYINEETGRPIIEEWYQTWQAYNRKTVQFLMDTGVLDAETATLWMKQSDYVPFYRQSTEPDADLGPNVPKVFSGMTSAAQFKKLEGSEKQINIPMLDAITRNLSAAVEMGMKNVAQQRVARDLIKMGLAERVSPLAKTAEGAGVISFKSKGQKVNVRINDPLIYESLLPLDAGYPLLEKYLGAPATFLREMITRDPGFVLTNMARDTLSAYVTSGSSFTPVIETVKNYAKDMNDLEKFGVVGGYDFGKDPKDIVKFINKNLKRRGARRTERGLTDNVVTDMFGGMWDTLGTLSTRSDFATRKAVYDDVLARTGNEAEAAFQALEVINFGRRGSNPVMRTLTAMIPFLNARLQGLDVLARAYTGGYGADKTKTRRQRAVSATVRSLYLTALTGMYYLLVSDDEQYKEQTDYIKDNHFIIPSDSGKPHKLPIPFEIGFLFKTIPERVLDSMVGESSTKEVQESVARGVFNTLELNPFDAAAYGPLIEASMNFDFFTGRSIVPYYIDRTIEPRLQSTDRTTEISKNVSNFLSKGNVEISPLKIDHLLYGYGGTLGSYVIDVVDLILKGDDPTKQRPMRMEDYPVMRRFRAREFGGGPSEDFYELKQYVDQLYGSMKQLEKQGRFDEASAYAATNASVIGYRKGLNEVADQLSELRKVEQIILSSDLPVKEKEKQQDELREARQIILRAIVPIYKAEIRPPLRFKPLN